MAGGMPDLLLFLMFLCFFYDFGFRLCWCVGVCVFVCVRGCLSITRKWQSTLFCSQNKYLILYFKGRNFGVFGVFCSFSPKIMPLKILNH